MRIAFAATQASRPNVADGERARGYIDTVDFQLDGA